MNVIIRKKSSFIDFKGNLLFFFFFYLVILFFSFWLIRVTRYIIKENERIIPEKNIGQEIKEAVTETTSDKNESTQIGKYKLFTVKIKNIKRNIIEEAIYGDCTSGKSKSNNRIRNVSSERKYFFRIVLTIVMTIGNIVVHHLHRISIMKHITNIKKSNQYIPILFFNIYPIRN